MADSTFFRVVSGRQIADKTFDEANIPTADEKAGISANSPTGANPLATESVVDTKITALGQSVLDEVDHDIEYRKAGVPTGAAAAEGEKCLDTTNADLYTFSSGSWSLTEASTTGDRYIHKNTGTDTGGDSGTHTATQNIYEYNGSTFDSITPNNGERVYVLDEDNGYFYNGSSWVRWETKLDHNLLESRQGGTTDEYYHITANQEAGLDAATAIAASNPPQTLSDRDKMPTNYSFLYLGGFTSGQSDVQMYESGGVVDGIEMPGAGSIVKISYQSSGDATAGTLTVEPTINGADATGNDLDLSISSGGTVNDATAATAPATTGLTFSSGDQIGVHLTSDGSWANGSGDIQVILYVVFDG